MATVIQEDVLLRVLFLDLAHHKTSAQHFACFMSNTTNTLKCVASFSVYGCAICANKTYTANKIVMIIVNAMFRTTRPYQTTHTHCM